MAFDVALHIGTAIVVIVFSLGDWINLLVAGLKRPQSSDGRLFWILIAATVPGAVFGVLLDKYMMQKILYIRPSA